MGGKAVATVTVYGDVTIVVTFAEKVDIIVDNNTSDLVEEPSGNILAKVGCSSIVGGLSMSLMAVAMGMMLVCKKKES